MPLQPLTASPEPGDGPPIASSPPPRASLGRLPYEVKELTVDHLMCIVNEENVSDFTTAEPAVGFFDQRDNNINSIEYSAWEQNENLRSLSQLDRDFSTISLSLIYKDLNLQWCSADSLKLFITDIAEFQAEHVRSIKANPGKTKRPHFMVTLGSRSGGRGRSEVPFPRDERTVLLGDVLRCCSSVTALSIVAEAEVESTREAQGQIEALRPIADTVKNLSANLETLSIAYKAAGTTSVSFLSPSTTINSFSLSYPERTSALEWAAVPVGLASLPNLRNLRLAVHGLLSDEFLARPPSLPLQSLELKNTKFSGAFSSLHTFVSKFAGTLAALNLDLCDANSRSVSPVPAALVLDLPHLASIALASQFDSAIFLCFARSTVLELFRIGRLPASDQKLERLLQLVRGYPITRIHLSEHGQEAGLNRGFGMLPLRAFLSEDDVDVFADACAARHVQLTGRVPSYLAEPSEPESYERELSDEDTVTDASSGGYRRGSRYGRW